MSQTNPRGGFVAADAVDPLDWDFTDFLGEEAKGTIPEPSQEAVKAFRKAMRAASPDGDPSELRTLKGEEADEANEAILDALVKLCGGKPSRLELDQLPFRVQRAFCGWLYGSLASPITVLERRNQ